MPWKTALVAGLLVLTALPATAQSDRIQGRAEVIDGDTLEFGFRRVDLWGVDTVERFQKCLENGRSNACGSQAIQALYDMTAGKTLRCDVIERNRVNRELVKCRSSEGRDINKEMVSRGWALANTSDGDEYVADERRAQQRRVNIWRWDFIPPREWRAGERLPEHEFKRSFRN